MRIATTLLCVAVAPLVRMYEPDILQGYDPFLANWDRYQDGNTLVKLAPIAAWIHSGQVRFVEAGLGGFVTTEKQGALVQCIDLAAVILDAPPETEVILKIDAESAEYDLVPHLVARDADLRLQEILVEWHCACGYGIWNGVHPDVGCDRDFDAWLARRDKMIAMLRCETKEWTL